MRLPYTLLSEAGRPPTRAHEHDAGLDLHAAEEVVLGPGERAGVGTAIAIGLPPGTAGLVLPRSRLAARHGITVVNAPGLVDAGYRGELRVWLLNTDRQEPFAVSIGDRIAQLVVVRVESPALQEVAALTETARGSAGFGSSGGFGAPGRFTSGR